MTSSAALRATMLCALTLAVSGLPAIAQTAKLPTGFITRVNQTTGAIEMQDGSGQWVPIGVVNPATHAFLPTGLPAETARAQSAEALALPKALAGTAATLNVGAPSGVAGLDATGRQPLAQDAVRAWQVTRAATPVLVAAGGSWSGFLASCNAVNPDATDGSYQAVEGGTPAPAGGVLSRLISAYLTGVLGVTPAQATADLQTIWANAAAIAP